MTRRGASTGRLWPLQAATGHFRHRSPGSGHYRPLQATSVTSPGHYRPPQATSVTGRNPRRRCCPSHVSAPRPGFRPGFGDRHRPRQAGSGHYRPLPSEARDLATCFRGGICQCLRGVSAPASVLPGSLCVGDLGSGRVAARERATGRTWVPSRIHLDRVAPRRPRAVAPQVALVDEREGSAPATGPPLGRLLRGDPDRVGARHERAAAGRGDPPDVPVLYRFGRRIRLGKGIHRDTFSVGRTATCRERAVASTDPAAQDCPGRDISTPSARSGRRCPACAHTGSQGSPSRVAPQYGTSSPSLSPSSSSSPPTPIGIPSPSVETRGWPVTLVT